MAFAQHSFGRAVRAPEAVMVVTTGTGLRPPRGVDPFVAALIAAADIGELEHPMREVALALARGGWRVFPCDPQLKRPLIPKGFHGRSADLGVVEAWWTANPVATIGIVPGDGGLIALDVDSPKAISSVRRAGLLPEGFFDALRANTLDGRHGLVIATGGSSKPFEVAGQLVPPLHLYLRAPTNGPTKMPDVVCRFDSGYVIAPGSLGRTRYRLIGRGCPLLFQPGPIPAVAPASSETADKPDTRNLRAPGLGRVRQAVAWIANPADTDRLEYVSMAHAIKGACGPQAEGEGLAIFLAWAARWDGPVDPVEDERVFSTIRWENLHTGWPQLWKLAERHGYNAAAERLAEAREEFAAAPLPDETPEAAEPGLVVADSNLSELQVSAAYRKALRDAVGQARSDIPNAADRAMHFEAIAYRLGQRFAVHPRAVREGLRALDAEAECAAAYTPPVEWLGPEDRDRLASAVPRYLVTDYVFADGAIHVLYGVPGSRKTFVALSWLLALATGCPWGGRYPVQQGGALLFAGEAAATLRVRRAAALAALSVTPEKAAALPFGVVPQLPPLGSADGVDAVRRLVDAHYHSRHRDVPLRVIALDTLTRLSQRAGASTTDPKEYGVLLDRVEQIAHATGASIVLLAHSPESTPDKPTGTYQTRGNADSVMKLERVDANSSRLTVEKAKDDVEGAPLILRFERQDVRRWLASSYERETRPLPAPLADALAVRDFDGDTDILPSEAELNALPADPVRATRDAALLRQFTSLILTEVVSEAPRVNGQGSREARVERHLLDWLGQHRGASKRDLRDSWSGRGQDVDKALLRLADRGLLENRGSPSRSAYYLADSQADATPSGERALPETKQSDKSARASHDASRPRSRQSRDKPAQKTTSTRATGRAREAGNERHANTPAKRADERKAKP